MKIKKGIKIFIAIIIIAAIIALIICLFNKGDKKDKTDANESSITITNSGWSFVEADTGNYISYGVELINNSKNKIAKEPIIKVIGKDKDGKELFNIDENIAYLSPNQQTYYGKTFSSEEKPDTIEFSIIIEDENFIETKDITYISKDDINLSNIEEIKDDEIIHYIGEIENKSSNNISQLVVSVIYKKDNKIVGGTYSYINNVPGNKTTPLVVDAMNIPEYDTYEINYISGDDLN